MQRAKPNFEASPVPPQPDALPRRREISVHNHDRRRPPSEREQARRRLLLLWSKWLMPIAALALLGSIAAWPALDRAMQAGKAAYNQVASVRADTGQMLGVRYHGVDARGNPYMITAARARQVSPDQIALVQPVADTLSRSGSWMLARAPAGVYMPHEQLLDLSGGVTFYRNDGTLMVGPTADIDVKRGVLASDNWVHAEGPFGVLDAQGDFMSHHDGVAQFRGPARLIINDNHPARAAKANPR